MNGRMAVSFLAGLAAAALTHGVRSVVPGSYGVKLGAQVATGAALTGAAYVGGAEPETVGAVAVGAGAAVTVHVSDQLQVSQAVSRLAGSLNSTSNAPAQGATNNQAAPQGAAATN
jgi:hypothetical protein